MDHADALLLDCLRYESPQSKIGRLKALKQEDWELLVHASQRWGTTPLLYRSLHPLLSDLTVPQGVQEHLRTSYHLSAGRNIRLYHQLFQLLRLCHSEGVAVMALKGAHLSQFVYGNCALRPMGDLDLLVKRSDIETVTHLLRQDGYLSVPQDAGSADVHIPVFSKKHSVPCEIHFNIVAPPFSGRFDVSDLWERARHVSLNGLPVFTLCPEDLLLHLCAHSTVQHGFVTGIVPFIDISRTLEHHRDELAWDQLLARAREWGMTRCLYLMLYLSKELMGTPVTDKTLQDLNPPSDSEDAVATAMQVLFHRGPGMSTGVARMFSGQGWSHTMKHFVKRVFPPVEIMSASNPQATRRTVLYGMYASRLRKVFQLHRKTAWLLLTRDRTTCLALESEQRRNRLKDWLTEVE